MQTHEAGVELSTNTHFRLAKSPGSHLVPDLATEVRVGKGYRKCIVVEVGMSQPLRELRKKAETWLYYAGGVHLVVLIDLREIRQAYRNKNGGVITKSAARKLADEWPAEWQGPEGELRDRQWFREQVEGKMREKGGVEAFLEQVKQELAAWMLERDEEEKLIPALVEPLDAHVYLYRRAQGVDGAEIVLPKPAPVPEDIQPVVENDGSGDEDHEDDDTDTDNEFTSTLDLVMHSKFMSLSTPTPTPTTLSFTLAELFGPLSPPSCLSPTSPPTIPPSLLADMPPHLRPHAAEKITFDMRTVADLLLRDMDAIRPDRAEDRAGKLVDGAYAGVWGGVEKRRREGEKAARGEEVERGRVERRRRREVVREGERERVEAGAGAGRKRKIGGGARGKRTRKERERGEGEGEGEAEVEEQQGAGEAVVDGEAAAQLQPQRGRRGGGGGRARSARVGVGLGRGRGGRTVRIRVGGGGADKVAAAGSIGATQ